MAHQGALRHLGIRRRRGKDGIGEDAFGEVVDALEATPRRSRDAPGPEEPFEGALAVAPAPPASRSLERPNGFAVRQLPGAERAALPHCPQHGLDEVGPLATEPRDARIDTFAAGGPFHAPAQERLQVEPHQRSLVPPIFEEAAPAPMVGRLVEESRIIGAKPREERHVVGAREDVDGIDLDKAEPIEGPRDIPSGDDPRPPGSETLRGERDAAGLRPREAFPATLNEN